MGGDFHALPPDRFAAQNLRKPGSWSRCLQDAHDV